MNHIIKLTALLLYVCSAGMAFANDGKPSLWETFFETKPSTPVHHPTRIREPRIPGHTRENYKFYPVPNNFEKNYNIAKIFDTYKPKNIGYIANIFNFLGLRSKHLDVPVFDYRYLSSTVVRKDKRKEHTVHTVYEAFMYTGTPENNFTYDNITADNIDKKRFVQCASAGYIKDSAGKYAPTDITISFDEFEEKEQKHGVTSPCEEFKYQYMHHLKYYNLDPEHPLYAKISQAQKK